MKRILLTILVCLLCCSAFSLDSFLLNKVLSETHYYVKDVDKNGKVNCIDYAITFKNFWDWIAPDGYSINCEIVRNVNKNKNFNHLFVRVRDNSRSDWEYVEPQGSIEKYRMEDYWGNRYDASCNIYGETYIWLLKKQ